MKQKVLIAILAIVVVLAVLGLLRLKRRTRKLNPDDFNNRWKALQKNCASRKNWPQAIIEADKLLDDALKLKHFKGKTTGERLVSAQRILTSNETVWFGHKLSNKIASQDVRTLKKQEILGALSGFRQALRDLGALKRD